MRLGLITTAVLALATAGCTDTVAMVPLNPQAQATGAPQLHYASGLPFGIAKVTMPDGETLPGDFTVDEATGHFHARANGPTTRLVCDGALSAGHGPVECRSQSGAVYRLPL